MEEWTINGDKCTRAPTNEEGFVVLANELLDGHTRLTTYIKVQFDDADEAEVAEGLRQAWKQVGLENPILNAVGYSHASHPENPRVEVTLLDTEQKLEAWADQTFIVDESTASAEVYLTPEYSHNEKYSLYWLKQSGELVLHGPHLVNDSYGSLLTMNRVLELYGKVGPSPALSSSNILASRLLRSYTSRLGCKPIKYDTFAECMEGQWLGKDIPKWMENSQKQAGLPNMKNLDNRKLAATKDSLVVRLDFTEEETQKVVANAKKLEATVGQLIWGACITALSRFPENNGKYFSCSAVNDIRNNFVDDPPCSGMHVVGWPAALPVTTSLKTNTTSMREYMEHYLPLLKRFPQDNHPELDEAVAAQELFNRRAASILETIDEFNYSQMVVSLGIVDGYIKPRYQKVRVERANICGRHTLPGSHNVWLTLNGKLSATFCYNEAFHEHKDIQENAKCVKRILLDCS